MVYVPPGQNGSKVTFKKRYENYIGGKWVPPVRGQYFDNVSPVNNEVFCEVPRSTSEDIELALDAAHAAKAAWGRTSAAERAVILNRIADRIEQNLEALAVAETWDNGKPIRETLAADLPLAIDHFRYFAGCIRRDRSAKSTTIRWRTIFTSRWGSSVRSFRGTSRCSWRRGSWLPRSRPAIASC